VSIPALSAGPGRRQKDGALRQAIACRIAKNTCSNFPFHKIHINIYSKENCYDHDYK